MIGISTIVFSAYAIGVALHMSVEATVYVAAGANPRIDELLVNGLKWPLAWLKTL